MLKSQSKRDKTLQHSITDAALMVGLNRKTLYRHIKEGRLSATVTATGKRQVETSELMRVYGPLATTGDTSGDSQLLASLLEEMKLLRQEVQSLKKQLALPKPNEITSIMSRLKAKSASRTKEQQTVTD